MNSSSFCDGKQRFETFSQANRIARLSAGRNHAAMRAYHCQNCGGFHFGNTMRPKTFNRRPEAQR